MFKPTDKDDKTRNSVENKLKQPACEAIEEASKLVYIANYRPASHHSK